MTNIRAPIIVGTNNTTALDIVAIKDRMFTINYNAGLEIVDISDPTAPLRIGGYDPEGSNCGGMDIAGNTIYLVDGNNGLFILDASNQSTPILAGELDIEAYPRTVFMLSGKAFMRSSDYIMEVVDVTSTTSPLAVCEPNTLVISTHYGIAPPNEAFTIFNAGSGTLDYDISTDSSWIIPQTASGSSLGETNIIELSFDTSGLEGGFHFGTVNITNSSTIDRSFNIPVELWIEPFPVAIDSPILPAGMEMVPYSEMLAAIEGTAPYTWAMVTVWPEGITNVIDGTVSGKPILEGIYSMDVTVTDARGRRFTGPVGLEIQRNPNRPPVISATSPATGILPLPESIDQPIIVTASDPETAPLSYSWTLDGGPVGDDSNQFNFITTWGDVGPYELAVLVSDGLWDTVVLAWTVEVTDDNDGDGIPNDFENSHPLLDAWVTADGEADPDNDHLDNKGEYLAGTLLDNPDCDNDSLPDGWEVQYGFNPLDNPGKLPGILCTAIGGWETNVNTTSASTLAVNGTDVYIGGLRSSVKGMRIINSADSSAPVEQGSYTWSTSSGFWREILYRDNYVYLAVEDMGISIFNVSNPNAPTRVALYVESYTINDYYGLCLDGNTLYAGAYYYGIKVLNISNPASPSLQYTIPDSTYAWDLAIQSNYLYAACGHYGLRIIDINTPTSASVVGTAPVLSQGQAAAIEVAGNYAYVAEGRSGLRIFDISAPTAPVAVGRIDTPVNAYEIHLNGSYVYLSDFNGDHMYIVNIDNPTAPQLVGSYDAGTIVYAAQCNGNLVYIGTGQGVHIVQTVSEDTDSDGISDADELTCGTSLGDDSDFLQCSDTAPAASDTGITISWVSVPGHSYRVEYCTDLILEDWTTVIVSITATDSICSVLDSSATSADGRYYRIIALP